MKLLIILLLTFSSVFSNDIYRNEDGDFYAYLENGEKVEFTPNGILINDDKISFNENYFCKLLGGQESHILNIYKDNIIKENIQVYSLINYNGIKVKLINDKLIIDDLNNNNIYLNNIKSDINKLNKYINFNNQDNILSDNFNLEYSTFLNKETKGRATSITTDEEGNVYITGSIFGGIDPILKGEFHYKNAGAEDVFIQKFDKNNKIIWATYLGTYDNDVAFGIIVKGEDLYICGSTRGNGFPGKSNVLRRFEGNGDGFVSQMTTDGKLIKTTYNGSPGYDSFTEMGIDNNDNLWVIGRSFNGGAYTSPDAINTIHSGYYDFLFMGISKLSDQVYSTYLGSEESETGDALCLLGDDFVVLGGKVNNTDEGSEGGRGKLYLFDKTTKSITWEKEIGTYGFTTVQNLESKDNNEFYISGYTNDKTISTSGAFQTDVNGLGQYIAKYNLIGNKLELTYIDGSSDEGVRTINYQKGGLHYNKSEDILAFGGFTNSSDLLTTNNAFQLNKMNGVDAYFGLINSNLSELNYLSYLGASKDEVVYDIRFENNSIYISGQSNSNDFHLSPDFGYSKELVSDNASAFFTKFYFSNEEKPCNNNVFNIKDFSKIKDFNLVQNAVVYDSILRLTKSDLYQKGAIWSNSIFDLTKGFNTKIKFRISEGKDLSEPDGYLPGADGIAFLIQTNSPKLIGVAGGGIGYEGLENCIAIEIDLYQNKDINYSDPNGNHIACFASKNQIIPDHNSTNLIAENTNLPIIKADNTEYVLEIDYNKSNNNLIVYLSELNQNKTEVLNIKDFKLNELINLLNNNSAFIGISAATGNSIQRQEILGWSFCGEQITTSVENNLNNYNLFPNPTLNKFYIEDINNYNEINIINYLGEEINFKSKLINGVLEIDLLNNNNGIYLIQINNNGELINNKIILNK